VTTGNDYKGKEVGSPNVHFEDRVGGFDEGTNNQRVFPSDGSGPIEFRMPDVATSYDEFANKCRARGLIAEAAIS
jgi:hypothetical protein